MHRTRREARTVPHGLHAHDERARLAAAALVTEQEALIEYRRQQVAAERRALIQQVGGMVAATARLILADLTPDPIDVVIARRDELTRRTA